MQDLYERTRHGKLILHARVHFANGKRPRLIGAWEMPLQASTLTCACGCGTALRPTSTTSADVAHVLLPHRAACIPTGMPAVAFAYADPTDICPYIATGDLEAHCARVCANIIAQHNRQLKTFELTCMRCPLHDVFKVPVDIGGWEVTHIRPIPPAMLLPTHGHVPDAALRIEHHSGCYHTYLALMWGQRGDLATSDPTDSPRRTLSFNEIMFEAFYMLTTGLVPPSLTNWSIKKIVCLRCSLYQQPD